MISARFKKHNLTCWVVAILQAQGDTTCRSAKIITTDRRDFSVYRRFGRHRLPVILPV